MFDTFSCCVCLLCVLVEQKAALRALRPLGDRVLVRRLEAVTKVMVETLPPTVALKVPNQ